MAHHENLSATDAISNVIWTLQPIRETFPNRFVKKPAMKDRALTLSLSPARIPE